MRPLRMKQLRALFRHHGADPFTKRKSLRVPGRLDCLVMGLKRRGVMDEKPSALAAESRFGADLPDA